MSYGMLRQQLHHERQAAIGQLMGSSDRTYWFFGPDLAWQKRAACGKADVPDSFFPGGGRPSHKSKEFCAGCPVREECLDWALSHGEQGIWGGMSESERNLLVISRLPIEFKETK